MEDPILLEMQKYEENVCNDCVLKSVKCNVSEEQMYKCILNDKTWF